MNKTLANPFFFISIALLALLLTSCNFPIFPTDPPSSTEPPPIDEPVEEPQDTPTPECVVVGNVDYLPTIGSRLRWMDASDFLYVPEGEFIMGAESEEREDFNPQHIVFLDDYWIQEAEVTNQQYARCVEAGICTPPFEEDDEPYRFADASYANYPVVGVDWYQAEDYCTWIEARLPSEAEWEKASRGFEGYKYPWGMDEPTCDLLNFDDCLDPSEPANILSYEDGQSLYEVMDLSGNVFEWVKDWYQEDYYFVSPSTNPTGPAEGLQRVYRGGSYTTGPEDILTWMRYNQEPEKHSAELGFRCALDGPEIKCSTITNSNVTVHPPPCQVPAVNVNQPEAQPTFTPVPPCAPANITPFCQWRNGSQISGMNISINNCYDNVLTEITGNGWPLNCTKSNTNPPVYNCEPPPGSAQGSLVEITYCHEPHLVQIQPECPAGYEFNPGSTFCEPIGPWLPEPPCPTGYVENANFGCLPDGGCGCPAGFFLNGDTCLPLDLCLWPDFPSCEEPVCAEGEVYDPENDCCTVPEKLKAVCPAGLVYVEMYNTCMMPFAIPSNCFITSVNLAYCPTLTPSPTPTLTPTPTPLPCSAYTDEKSCENNGCNWYCVYFGGTKQCQCVP